MIFEFAVKNNATCKITIKANTEEEARVKLENFDIEDEIIEDDYDFQYAELECSWDGQ